MPDMLSDDQITEIQERLQRLPDRPWYVEHARPGHEDEARVYDRGSWGVCKPTPDNPAYRRPIAEFVAHAPEDIAGLLALVDKLRSDRDEVVSQSVELNAVFEAVMDTLDGRQVSDFMSSFQPVLIAQDAIEGREASLARLRTEVEGLHQERDEIRSALGLMAGGVGLSLAEEIEEIKHQSARLRTALVGLRSHWRNWCASSRPQVYNPVYREWHTTAESRMDQEVEAALASTRPDASPEKG